MEEGEKEYTITVLVDGVPTAEAKYQINGVHIVRKIVVDYLYERI